MSAALVRFALVGLAGSLVYFALLWSMVDLLHWPVIPASCCAFVLVVVENYLLHRAWTFHSTAPHGQALPGFVLVSVVGFCVNGAVMALGVEWLGLNYLAVQLVAIGVVVVCNFVGAQRIFGPRRTLSQGKDAA